MTDFPKLCKDCKWSRPFDRSMKGDTFWCVHPKHGMSLATGEPNEQVAEVWRDGWWYPFGCRASGRFWEPKEVEQQ